VAGVDGFKKEAYRKFNIKMELGAQGDDYAMMREVLSRRFVRLKKEEGDQRENWPDLLLIDGGLGHFTTVQTLFKELQVDVPFICIAKGRDRNAGREQFFMLDRKGFMLPPNTPLLYYLQILRDEAHRFAIGAHRNKRQKSQTVSVLDDIPTIGLKRKQALLRYFGSTQAIRSATIEELGMVQGINDKTAIMIHQHFH